MALILSLETTAAACSVAVHSRGTFVAGAESKKPQAHAEELATLIKNCLNDAAVSFDQLKAVAVSGGPGSFTGLRIGVSTAKGLCYALGIPLLAVPTLEAMALSARSSSGHRGLYCPMIDARRMEVYCALYNSTGDEVYGAKAMVIDDRAFAGELEENRVAFFGTGAEKCRRVIVHPNALYLDGITPGASAVGELAWHRYAASRWEDLAVYEPFYLKEFFFRKPAGVY
jgi:tRNA threonylcarbamoyladenosine biosynthesis protein TsaB